MAGWRQYVGGDWNVWRLLERAGRNGMEPIGAVRSSPRSSFERIQHVHVQSRHVRHVACHEGQAMGLGRRGQERIDDR